MQLFVDKYGFTWEICGSIGLGQGRKEARNENNTDMTANNPTGSATASTTEQRENGLPGSVACDGYNNSFDENTQVMDSSEPASAHVPVPNTNGIPRLV